MRKTLRNAGGADVELVAGVLGYDVRIDGLDVCSGASSEAAIAQARAACDEAARKVRA